MKTKRISEMNEKQKLLKRKILGHDTYNNM